MDFSHRRPRNRTELSAHICVVAHALFQSEGYAGVTMERIARQAAVSKRTLYKYYPVKEALLERVLEKSLADDLADYDFGLGSETSFRAAVVPLLQASAHWYEQHPDYLLPYVRYKFATFEPSADPGEDRGLLPLWTTLIAAAQGRGEFRSKRSAEQLGVYFHYLYLAALMRWLTTPQLDLQDEFNVVIELFLEGACQTASRQGIQ